MTADTLTKPTPVEIVPTDPGDRLAQINAQLEEGENLAREGQRLILSAISQVISEPEILEASKYANVHDWLERQHGWQRTNRYKAIKAAKAYASVDGKVEALPQSIHAFDALGSVDEDERIEILEKAGGASATADSIKAAANPSATADDLPIYKPDSSPEAIQEGLDAGYIKPTITLADGKRCEIGDHIAYAESPTALVGRVTGFTPQGRIEYTRFGKVQYIDPQVVVHQQSVASPAAVPQQATSPAADAQTTAENPTPVTGDSKGRSFAIGQVIYIRGTQTHYCIARWGQPPHADAVLLWGYSEELWATLDEIEPVTAPSPLSLEDIAQFRLKKLVKVLGGKAVADMALDQLNSSEARQVYEDLCPTSSCT